MGNADDRSQSRPRRPWHNPNFNLGTLLSGVLAAIVGVTWLVGLESTSDKRWELYEAHRAADKELDARAEKDLDRRLAAIEASLLSRHGKIEDGRRSPAAFSPFSPVIDGVEQ